MEDLEEQNKDNKDIIKENEEKKKDRNKFMTIASVSEKSQIKKIKNNLYYENQNKNKGEKKILRKIKITKKAI